MKRGVVSPDTETSRSDHLPGWDGLRGLAATAVLILHTAVLRLSGHAPAQDFVAQLQSGVQVFFMISGFVVARPFVVAVLDGLPQPGLRHYAWRRFFRIFPAYWLALIGSAILLESAPVSGTWNWLLHLSLLQVYRDGQLTQGISVAWTLSVEVTFYALLPLLFLGIERLARRVGPVRALVWSLVGVCAVGSVYVYWSGSTGHYWQTFWFPFQMPLFAIGTLLCVWAELARRRPNLRTANDAIARLAPLWWSLALATLLLAAAWFGTSVLFRLNHQIGMQVLYGAVAFFAVLPLATGLRRRGVIGWFLRSSPVVYVGVVSYGLYLWHNQLTDFVASDIFGWAPAEGNALAITIGVFVLSLAIASASWFLLERPLGRWSRRLR